MARVVAEASDIHIGEEIGVACLGGEASGEEDATVQIQRACTRLPHRKRGEGVAVGIDLQPRACRHVEDMIGAGAVEDAGGEWTAEADLRLASASHSDVRTDGQRAALIDAHLAAFDLQGCETLCGPCRSRPHKQEPAGSDHRRGCGVERINGSLHGVVGTDLQESSRLHFDRT